MRTYFKFVLILVSIVSTVYSQSYDWPSFGGPNGNLSGTPSGVSLLEDLSFAKLFWVSEENDLGKGKFTTSDDNGSNTGVSPGGHSTPIIYDGMVYVAYYRPSGTEYDTSMYNTAVRNGQTPTPEFYRIRADDLMVAISLDSGKTIWKKQYNQSGMNILMNKRDGWAVTPIAFGGKIFHLTTLGELYCYHAKTGVQIWQSATGINRSYMQGLRTSALASYTVNGGSINFNFGMVEADGILIVGDYQEGLYGIDTSDGSEIWHKSGIRRGCATPTIVSVNEKKYVLVASRTGQLSLINPVNGNYMWQVSNVGGYALEDIPFSMFSYQDIVIHTVSSGISGRGYIVGTRITPSGPQLLWKLDTNYYQEIKWDNGPRPWYAAKDSIFICLPHINKLLFIHAFTGAILHEEIAYAELPLIVEDRLLTNSDMYHAPTQQNSISMYTINPSNVVKLGGWTPPHKNSGGYDVPLLYTYSQGKLIFRSAEIYNPPNGRGGDLRCYDIIFHPQVFTSFTLTPQSIILSPSSTTLFSFTAKDQNGITMKKEPHIIWSVSGGGTIDTNGLLTAGTAGGQYYVYAAATVDSITLFDTASFYIKNNQTISCPSYTNVFSNSPPFELGCTASSGLPVTYTKVSGPFTLSGSIFTPLGVSGTARINVTQAGNEYYNPAPGYALVFSIQVATLQEELNTSTFSLSPNPTSGIIKIDGAGINGQMTEIYSILGEKIITTTLHEKMDLSFLPNGIYFIKINSTLYKIIKR